MSRSGQRADAVTALIGMADRMRSELADREDELLSLFGMLFLAASITAATQDDAALAFAMHEEAIEAADRMGPTMTRATWSASSPTTTYAESAPDHSPAPVFTSASSDLAFPP